MECDNSESEILTTLSLCSYKPIIHVDGEYDINNIIEIILEKTSNMFFYTSGTSEYH